MAIRTPIPLDTPLAELDFVAFDTETTGCSSANGRMVEIGAVRFRLDGTEIDRFTQLINPLRPIPRSVTAIHGITDAMVRDCHCEENVLPPFLDFLGDASRTILMAHNAPFDLGFVGASLARCRLAPPTHAVIDTVQLARRRAGGLPSHSLRSLVRVFGIADSTDHRGLADSLALRQVFLNLVRRPPSPMTAGDLFALTPVKTMRVGAGAGRRSPSDRSVRGHSSGRRAFATSPLAAPSFASPSFASEGSGSMEIASNLLPGGGDDTMRLTEAIASGQVVSLVYDGGRTAGKRRRVTPLRLIASASVTYLLAWCHTDAKQKQYRMDRIRELQFE